VYLRTGGGISEFHAVGPGTGPEVEHEELGLFEEELDFAGASRNLTHSIFQIEASGPNERKAHNEHSNLWPGDTTKPGAHSLYEYAYRGSRNSEPILVGVKNNGALHGSPAINDGAELLSSCGTALGSGSSGSAYNAVSESGNAVFFTALACAGNPQVNELYVRINSESTIDLSEPSKGDCEACETTTAPGSAIFEGASQNGDKVFFLTEQELLPGQKGMNLYEYDIEGPNASIEHPDGKISLISSGSNNPDVQGVARISENGDRVYFVAKGKLTGSNRVTGRQPEEAEPQEEADNLYVYEADPERPGTFHVVFVADLLTNEEEAAVKGEEESEAKLVEGRAEDAFLGALYELMSRGETESEAIPQAFEVFIKEEDTLTGALGKSGTLASDTSVWQQVDRRPVQTTPDGRFVVFLSSAELTEGDKSSVPQLFEYDAEREALTRVSIGQDGSSTGNVETFRSAPRIPVQSFAGIDLPTAATTGLAVSQDGARVFFTSAASLTSQVERGTTNVYEYHAGDVYLVSGGNDASLYEDEPSVALFGVDPSGQDAFFTTAGQLVPEDGETQMALYDAREEGGFPAPALEPGCGGEGCRGPLNVAPQPQLPGSAGQTSGDNAPPLAALPRAKSSKPSAKAKRGKLARALMRCRTKSNKRNRTRCEDVARQRDRGRPDVGKVERKVTRLADGEGGR
jgi:hypothetical protein